MSITPEKATRQERAAWIELHGKYVLIDVCSQSPTEEMFFEGDQHPLNPMRYLPTPFHTKFAQQRTALSQYIQQEAVGTRMRRWERPLHDFLLPYLRGAVARVTGEDVIPQEVQHRRDLDSLVDMLQFLRAEGQTVEGMKHSKDQVPPSSFRPLPAFQSAPAPSPDSPGKQRIFSGIMAFLQVCSAPRCQS